MAQAQVKKSEQLAIWDAGRKLGRVIAYLSTTRNAMGKDAIDALWADDGALWVITAAQGNVRNVLTSTPYNIPADLIDF